MMALFLLQGCSSSTTLPTNASPPAPPLAANVPTQGPDLSKVKPVATVRVTITDKGFTPQKLTVKPNTLVVWKNEGTKAHNITLANTQRTAGTIERGATVSHLFTDPGSTNPYYDSFYMKNQGVVWVK